MAADAVELKIPADPQMIRVARLTVSAVASQNDISVEVLEDLKLAVSEACTERLDSGAARNWLFITIGQEGDELWIEVRGDEQGKRADQAPEQEERVWGMALMEALMDAVELDSDDQGRRIIRLRKRLRG